MFISKQNDTNQPAALRVLQTVRNSCTRLTDRKHGPQQENCQQKQYKRTVKINERRITESDKKTPVAS